MSGSLWSRWRVAGGAGGAGRQPRILVTRHLPSGGSGSVHSTPNSCCQNTLRWRHSVSMMSTGGVGPDLSRPTISATATEAERVGLRNASEEPLPSLTLPDQARVVICGGGAQGAAIAYKLAQRGLGPDTVVIDKGEFGGGTTWHSSGLVGLLKFSPVETRLSRISRDLYHELEAQGYYTGWKPVGSLYVAQTKERMHHYRRLKSEASGRDVDCQILGRDGIGALCPIIKLDDLEGGLWVPGDGVANPLEICLALTQLASRQGVKFVSNCEVERVEVQNGQVQGVTTNQGYIPCDHFVNTAGYWSRYVGTLSYPRVHVPLHPAEHYFLHTKPVANLPPNNPVVRDPDSHIYFRENEGRFLAGGFEPKAKPAFEDGFPLGGPRDLTVDWDHFYVLLEGLLKRVPSMENAILDRLTNGPEPFSPDGQWILGQAPEVKQYYVAAAMRSIGVGAAGGVGEVIADYITKGRTPFDMYNLDIQRFLPLHNNRKFLRDRVREVPGLIYAIPYPFSEFKTGRALRTSPIFTKLKEAGARFNQVMGYERPMYFEKESLEPNFLGLEYIKSDGEREPKPEDTLNIAKSNTFYKPSWFSIVEKEFIAAREKVALCDYTSFAKMDIWSSNLEVVDYMQKLCSNDVNIPIGSIIHTGMQNEEGGFENDCSVARLAENRYMLMSPSIQQMKSYSWMKKHLPLDNSVYLHDVTSLYTSLCLMGPKSLGVLEKITDMQLDSKAFPFFTFKYLDIGCAPDILTMNITHTGELGCVFYIPNEFALHVFETLFEAGQEFGIKHLGYYAMRALRIEKFYAFWGQDLDSNSTPKDCGRNYRVKIHSDIDFIGKERLAQMEKEGRKKILVMLLLDRAEHNYEADPWPWGNEPIFRNGHYVGTVTTASYGFSLKRHVALGFVHRQDDQDGVTDEWVRSV
ncbi:hypothetical protein TCAL_10396 [Tigriopus californicus]|uniref:Pyruvate dehydrogenase phosphatase regulatory subunit, mitochondrial n=1 Tax=Tigriopus californicus TaxID=6832 RepID=A0A553NQZ9_TIGCA|nr:hypothetical protein TCAL_10396 [Tigriopus californicus]